MNITYSLSLIIILFSVSYSLECSGCATLENFRCVICYDSCGNNNIFKNCTVSSCQTQGITGCAQYRDYSQSQSMCFSRCCGGQISTPNYNFDDLNQCVQLDGSEVVTDRVISIVLGSILGLCIILSCCGFCYNNSRGNPNLQNRSFCSRICLQCWNFITCHQCHRCRRRNNIQHQPNQERPDNLPSADRIVGAAMIRNEEIWEDQQINSVHSLQRTCTICLEPESNTTSKCKHYFHLECIFEWIKMRNNCPNCNCTDIQPMKIYCRSCKKKYATLNLRSWRGTQQIKERLNGQICTECR